MIKFGAIKDACIGIPTSDGGYEYKKLASIETIEPETDMNQDNYKHFISSPMTLTFTGAISTNPRALYYFFANGNDTYIKFPKKLRRKKGWTKK